MSFTLVPTTGYELFPADIIVTDGTFVSYDRSTGVLVVTGTNATTISAECKIVYSVTVTYTGGYDCSIYDGQNSSGTYLTHIASDGSETVTCTSGYLYFTDSSGKDILIYSASGCSATNPTQINTNNATITVTVSGGSHGGGTHSAG